MTDIIRVYLNHRSLKIYDITSLLDQKLKRLEKLENFKQLEKIFSLTPKTKVYKNK